MEPDYRFVHDIWLPCYFNTLIVQARFLEEKYPGGIIAFIEEYGAVFNTHLVAVCRMSSTELDEALESLRLAGLVYGEEIAIFDSFCLGVFRQDGDPLMLRENWLEARKSGHGVAFRFAQRDEQFENNRLQ